MSLLSPIQGKYVSYSVDIIGNGIAYLKGRRVKTSNTINIELCVIPMDRAFLNNSPEGDFNSQDIKIYREGEDSQLPAQSILTYKNNRYTIRAYSNRVDNGGFSMWIGKRIKEK